MTDASRGWGRRQVLRTGAGALGGAAVGWTVGGTLLPPAAPAGTPAEAGLTSEKAGGVGTVGADQVTFHGKHQAGVVTPAQAHLSLLGLNMAGSFGNDELIRLLTLITEDGSRLSRGVPALADTEPELAITPARLTVTVGFGPAIMRRFATSGHVKPLPAFRTDRLAPAWGQTDLAIQICADDPLSVTHARRMILKDVSGLATLKWIQNGFRNARGTVDETATPRNVMGQVDGTVNPKPSEKAFDSLIWSSERGFEGGTFMVVRRIRTLLDTWDKVDRRGREQVIGRKLDSGAPLTGTQEHDQADFTATDDLGFPVIDPASHMARARPRTPTDRILRRPYNYVVPDPHLRTGEDSGLVFIAYAANLETQFVPIQRRIASQDRLNEWVTPIGSAVYAIPPGVTGDGYIGEKLFTKKA